MKEAKLQAKSLCISQAVGVSLVEQDTIENVSVAYLKFIKKN
jgi:hypothetical protein